MCSLHQVKHKQKQVVNTFTVITLKLTVYFHIRTFMLNVNSQINVTRKKFMLKFNPWYKIKASGKKMCVTYKLSKAPFTREF